MTCTDGVLAAEAAHRLSTHPGRVRVVVRVDELHPGNVVEHDCDNRFRVIARTEPVDGACDLTLQVGRARRTVRLAAAARVYLAGGAS